MMPAALAYKVFGEVGIALFAGGLGEFDECHFGDFVPGIAVQLAVGGAESGIDVISETAGRVKQLAFAGGLIVGDRAFGQVAEAVQLMVVLQVGEVPVHAVEDVVGVQVAVVELRRADDIDGGVGGRFKVSVRVVGQRVADRFDPFGEISVLEHEAVELVGIGVRRVVRQQLIELGHPVIEAENAEQALAMVEQISDITIVVSDVLMPRLAAQARESATGWLPLWRSSTVQVAILLVPAAVLSWAFAEPLITLLFSSRFVEAAGLRWHLQMPAAPQPDAPVVWRTSGLALLAAPLTVSSRAKPNSRQSGASARDALADRRQATSPLSAW